MQASERRSLSGSKNVPIFDLGPQEQTPGMSNHGVHVTGQKFHHAAESVDIRTNWRRVSTPDLLFVNVGPQLVHIDIGWSNYNCVTDGALGSGCLGNISPEKAGINISNSSIIVQRDRELWRNIAHPRPVRMPRLGIGGLSMSRSLPSESGSKNGCDGSPGAHSKLPVSKRSLFVRISGLIDSRLSCDTVTGKPLPLHRGNSAAAGLCRFGRLEDL